MWTECMGDDSVHKLCRHTVGDGRIRRTDGEEKPECADFAVGEEEGEEGSRRSGVGGNERSSEGEEGEHAEGALHQLEDFRPSPALVCERRRDGGGMGRMSARR